MSLEAESSSSESSDAEEQQQGVRRKKRLNRWGCDNTAGQKRIEQSDPFEIDSRDRDIEDDCQPVALRSSIPTGSRVHASVPNSADPLQLLDDGEEQSSVDHGQYSVEGSPEDKGKRTHQRGRGRDRVNHRSEKAARQPGGQRRSGDRPGDRFPAGNRSRLGHHGFAVPRSRPRDRAGSAVDRERDDLGLDSHRHRHHPQAPGPAAHHRIMHNDRNQGRPSRRYHHGGSPPVLGHHARRNIDGGYRGRRAPPPNWDQVPDDRPRSGGRAGYYEVPPHLAHQGMLWRDEQDEHGYNSRYHLQGRSFASVDGGFHGGPPFHEERYRSTSHPWGPPPDNRPPQGDYAPPPFDRNAGYGPPEMANRDRSHPFPNGREPVPWHQASEHSQAWPNNPPQLPPSANNQYTADEYAPQPVDPSLNNHTDVSGPHHADHGYNNAQFSPVPEYIDAPPQQQPYADLEHQMTGVSSQTMEFVVKNQPVNEPVPRQVSFEADLPPRHVLLQEIEALKKKVSKIEEKQRQTARGDGGLRVRGRSSERLVSDAEPMRLVEAAVSPANSPPPTPRELIRMRKRQRRLAKQQEQPQAVAAGEAPPSAQVVLHGERHSFVEGNVPSNLSRTTSREKRASSSLPGSLEPLWKKAKRSVQAQETRTIVTSRQVMPEPPQIIRVKQEEEEDEVIITGTVPSRPTRASPAVPMRKASSHSPSKPSMLITARAVAVTDQPSSSDSVAREVAQRSAPSCVLVFRNLPEKWRNEDLHDMLSLKNFKVQNIHFLSVQVAKVTFDSIDTARACRRLYHKSNVVGSLITVSFDESS